MPAKPLLLALALCLASPVLANEAGDDGATVVAASFAPETAAAPAPRGLLGLFAPKSDEERAARKAEREAAREARKAARANGTAAPQSAQEIARAELKAAVEHAMANRPKGRLWCVPFARAISGVDIRGNAKTWWAQAEGLYARGKEPQVGAVMAFAASRAMPKGHVGVVSKVVSDREILLDHANWVKNKVTLDVLVVDVSEKGDWSAVKVANADGTLGRVNPINGFIYN